MIKYKLICKNCDLSFDSWFASSNEYEKLKKKNFLNCIKCNSKKVEKNLMAPKVINKSPKIKIEKNDLKFSEKNFDYVGENFAYQARSIHYNNKKNKKGIFGTASKKEIKELKEEGIEAEIIPWLEDKNN